MSHRVMVVAIAVVGLGLTGCSKGGPVLAEVSGIVKLDGSPLPNALLLYIPANGRTSFGRTDTDGQYRLYYTDSKMGAIPGEHTIRISTRIRADQSSGTPGSPELLPPAYNTKSELKRTVEKSSNAIDFELISKGAKIPQPKE